MKKILFKQKKIILAAITLSVFLGFSDIYAQSFMTDSENLRERLLQLGFPDFLKAYQERVRIFDAWDKIKESGTPLFPVAIGIIDSGIDARDGRHPEFENVNLKGSRPFALQDRAEYFYGSDYASGHGTKVAGIIGANNLSSTSSINYRFPQMNGILSGVTDNYNLISETGLVVDFTPQGLGIIADRMPQNAVVNISYISKKIKDEDFNDFTGYWRDVFKGNLDKTFIIAAGNDNQNVTTLTPQNVSATNTIIVGATDLNDSRLIVSSIKASNFGIGVDLSAPGENIYTPAIRGKGDFPGLGPTVPPVDNYSKSSAGTSLSAPMVTGVAGLLKAIKPALSPAQIKQILIETADPITTDKPIGGRLNAYKAVCHPLVGLDCVPPAKPITCPFSGTISEDSIIRTDQSPCVIQGVLTIPSGTTLAIDPGVVIKFAYQSSELIVNGILNANGTASQPIYFTFIKDDSVGGDTNNDGSATVPAPRDWRDIVINPGAIANFNYSTIGYGGDGGAGLIVNGGSLSLSNSRLTQNYYRNLYVASGTVDITSSEIDNSQTGISQYGGAVNVSQSSVHDNMTFGAHALGSPNPMNARNNFWGDSTGPYHPTLNPTGFGNAVSDNVNFIPFLTADPVGSLP